MTSDDQPGDLFNNPEWQELIEIARQVGLDAIDVRHAAVPDSILRLVPASVARECVVLPLGTHGRRLKVVVSKGFDIDSIDKLRFILGREIDIALTLRPWLEAAIEWHYAGFQVEDRSVPLDIEDLTEPLELEYDFGWRRWPLEGLREIARERGLRMIDPATIQVPESILSLIPATKAWAHSMLPYCIQGGTLTVIIHDPLEAETIKRRLAATIHRPIEIALAPLDELWAAIERHYGPRD
jgi:hypothetical protein